MSNLKLNTVIERLPFCQQQSFTIERLPGLTNRTYRLHNEQFDYVLRLPGAGSSVVDESYIKRTQERHNVQQAVKLELVPEVIYADDNGLQLSRYIAGRSLQPNDFHQPERLQQALSILRKLHQSGYEFQGSWPIFATLERCTQASSEFWQARLKSLITACRILEPELKQQAWQYCPCHCDANPANFRLDNNHRLWLLDWEYSAQAEPAWDLATLANETGLSSHVIADHYWLEPAPHLARRIKLYQILLNALAASWNAAQANADYAASYAQKAWQHLQQ